MCQTSLWVNRCLTVNESVAERSMDVKELKKVYFNGFKKLIEDNPIYRDMVLIRIEPCGAETMRVISQAERYVKDNHIEKGQIWCVYDKDSFPAKNFNGVVSRAESRKFDTLNRRRPVMVLFFA